MVNTIYNPTCNYSIQFQTVPQRSSTKLERVSSEKKKNAPKCMQYSSESMPEKLWVNENENGSTKCQKNNKISHLPSWFQAHQAPADQTNIFPSASLSFSISIHQKHQIATEPYFISQNLAIYTNIQYSIINQNIW